MQIVSKNTLMRSVALTTIGTMLITGLAPISVLALEQPIATTDHNHTVKAEEVAVALKGVSGLLESSDDTSTQTDNHSALQAVTAGSKVNVPKDSTQPVSIENIDKPTIKVTLPHAKPGKYAKNIAAGTVAYDSDDGSASAVQALKGGGVRMLSIMDNSQAPTTYNYDVDIPQGGYIKLAKDGGAVVYDRLNDPIASIDAPWSKDAHGKAINTYFSTNGKTLTQHVQHRMSGVSYPVTADPIWFTISMPLFWWAVRQCAAGAAMGAVFEYMKGGRSAYALSGEAAAGCIMQYLGGGAAGWNKLRNIVRILHG